MLHHAQTLKSFGKNKSMFVSSAISLLLILVCCVLTDFVDGFGTRAVILRRTGLRQPKTSSFTFCTRRSGKNNDDDDDNDNDNRSGGGFRESEFGQMTSGIARTGMKNLESYQVGDIVVAKYEIANLNIWVDCGYEIQELYLQGVNRETGTLEKLDLPNLGSPDAANKVGYTRYLKIYNSACHKESGPVTVTPEEIGLVSLKSELIESLWLMVPGFFWVFLSMTFASNYNDRYGGNFFDALFRT